MAHGPPPLDVAAAWVRGSIGEPHTPPADGSRCDVHVVRRSHGPHPTNERTDT
jgi:hypothetical protein